MEFKNGTTAAKYRASVELLQVEHALLSCLDVVASKCQTRYESLMHARGYLNSGQDDMNRTPDSTCTIFLLKFCLYSWHESEANNSEHKQDDGIYVSFTYQSLNLLSYGPFY